MDTLGPLVFSILIVKAARVRNVSEGKILTRYIMLSGVFASVGLIIIYLTLIKIGANSCNFLPQNTNGTIILHTYIQYTYGKIGIFFLSALLSISCIVTAIGLTCSCAEFFEKYCQLSYRQLVCIIGFFQ